MRTRSYKILVPVLAALVVAFAIAGFANFNNKTETTVNAADDTVKVYFSNYGTGWGVPNCHFWGVSGNVTSDRIGDTDIYEFNIPAGATFLFHNGSSWDGSNQTTDIASSNLVADTLFYCINNSYDGSGKRNWGSVASYSYGTTHIYFSTGSTDWGTPVAHCWSGFGADVDVTGDQVVDDIYEFDIPNGYDFLLHNGAYYGGSNQTSDIRYSYGVMDADRCFHVDGTFNGNGNHNWQVMDSFEFNNAQYAKTFYFNNEGNWEHVYVYYWKANTTGGFARLKFPGAEMSQVGTTKSYTFTINGEYDYVMFSNGSNSTTSGALQLQGSSPYRYTFATELSAGGWCSEAQYAMKLNPGWYLIGKIEGTANWNDSTYIADDSYSMPASGGNGAVAKWENVTLDAKDEIKVMHSNAVPANDSMKHAGLSYGLNTIDEHGNALITYDGVYDVTLYVEYFGWNEENWYFLLDWKGDTETSLDLKAVKSKVSTDNGHLLLIAAFDYSKLEIEGSYTMGFSVNGVETGEIAACYNAVNVKTATGYTRVEAGDIYGEDYADYKLIVYEIEVPSGSTTYNVRVYIKNGGKIVAYSDLVSGTVNNND